MREAEADYALPTGPFADDILPTRAETGPFRQQAWRVNAGGLTTLQLIRPLRQQLVDAGYVILFECETETCGGFDFRFGTPVLPPPAMYVDLGDFRFLSAQSEGDVVTLLASRSANSGFIQVITVGAEIAPATTAAPARSERPAVDLGDFGAVLETDGRVVLADLAFQTGSSSLGDGPFNTLQSLADYLLDNPDRRIALVGHTDAEGSLEGNIALSRRRANSVLDRLVESYGVPRGQMEAQGMGYLAPLSTNLTAEGRDLNRRVEVIVTNTP